MKSHPIRDGKAVHHRVCRPGRCVKSSGVFIYEALLGLSRFEIGIPDNE